MLTANDIFLGLVSDLPEKPSNIQFEAVLSGSTLSVEASRRSNGEIFFGSATVDLNEPSSVSVIRQFVLKIYNEDL